MKSETKHEDNEIKSSRSGQKGLLLQERDSTWNHEK